MLYEGIYILKDKIENTQNETTNQIYYLFNMLLHEIQTNSIPFPGPLLTRDSRLPAPRL
jgi:hypothetical protein